MVTMHCGVVDPSLAAAGSRLAQLHQDAAKSRNRQAVKEIEQCMAEHKKGVFMDRAIARRLAFWSESSCSETCPTPEEEGMLYICIDGMDQEPCV